MYSPAEVRTQREITLLKKIAYLREEARFQEMTITDIAMRQSVVADIRRTIESAALEVAGREATKTEGLCAEYNDHLPTHSEHLWKSGVRGEPSGCCLKCGESVSEYNRRMVAVWERLIQETYRGLPLQRGACKAVTPEGPVFVEQGEDGC